MEILNDITEINKKHFSDIIKSIYSFYNEKIDMVYFRENHQFKDSLALKLKSYLNNSYNIQDLKFIYNENTIFIGIKYILDGYDAWLSLDLSNLSSQNLYSIINSVSFQNHNNGLYLSIYQDILMIYELEVDRNIRKIYTLNFDDYSVNTRSGALFLVDRFIDTETSIKPSNFNDFFNIFIDKYRIDSYTVGRKSFYKNPTLFNFVWDLVSNKKHLSYYIEECDLTEYELKTDKEIVLKSFFINFDIRKEWNIKI